MENSTQANRERLPLFWFFALMFLCWIGFIPMIAESYGKKLPGPVKLLQLIMLLGPAIIALGASYINGGWQAVKDLLKGFLVWRVHYGWYILAILGPPFCYAISLWISNVTGITNKNFPEPSQILIAFLVSFGIQLLLNTEEFAWRGYVLPRMQKRMGIVWATIIIGVIWGVIHLPLFWLKGGHPAGYSFPDFVVRVLFMNFLFSAVYYGTTRSLLLVHFLHQSFNAGIEAIPVYPRAVHSIVPMSIATFFLFLIGIFLLIRLIRRHPELNSVR
jgi:membrane protease YdiL (CAAX protease family)